MAIETELKLIAPASAIRALPRLSWLREMASGPARKEKLVSLYFDTPDCKLQRNGLALRLRRQGGKQTQTIKTADGGEGALSRSEWDSPIRGNRPDLNAAKDTPLASLLNNGAEKTVRAVFETRVERITIPLKTGQSSVELALDRGFILAGKRREPLHEIELELKHGDSRDLAAIAERFTDAWPFFLWRAVQGRAWICPEKGATKPSGQGRRRSSRSAAMHR